MTVRISQALLSGKARWFLLVCLFIVVAFCCFFVLFVFCSFLFVGLLVLASSHNYYVGKGTTEKDQSLVSVA